MSPFNRGPPNQPNTFWAPWAKKMTARTTRMIRRDFEGKMPTNMSISCSSRMWTDWTKLVAKDGGQYVARTTDPCEVLECVRKRCGRWVVDYRDPSGVRRWITCQTRREAESVLETAIRD